MNTKEEISNNKNAFLNIYHESNWLFNEALTKPELEGLISREYLKPQEDEKLKHWLAQFLTLRKSLWEIIEEAELHLDSDIDNVQNDDDWRILIVGYASACLLMTMDKRLVVEIGYHKLIQRKLNETATEYNIPKKSFSKIYSSLTKPKYALALRQVREFVKKNNKKITEYSSDEVIAEIILLLPTLENTIQINELTYLKHRINYLIHSIKRRWASSKQKTLFKVLEASGRVLSEIQSPKSKRVTPEIIEQAKQILQPGDVLISRHDFVASNYLLPGFWPHSALYVGDESQARELNIDIAPRHKSLWKGEVDTLEAQKDGVRLKPLSEMLHVDNFVIIRPQINAAQTKQAIEQILIHEGKKYNFDFDFFRSDRLVCTEVIYRAFDGIGTMQFNLTERAGRFTLSAEELLDMALEAKHFKPIAIFGYDLSESTLCTDANTVRNLLIKSYQ